MINIILLKFKYIISPVCGKYSQTEFAEKYKNYCNFFNKPKKNQLVFVKTESIHSINYIKFFQEY